MPGILWGEGDVRDAMMEFDPRPQKWAVVVVGQRGPISVHAYWAGPPTLSQCGYVYDFRDAPSRYCRSFDDPIEAIQYALSLVREGVWHG